MSITKIPLSVIMEWMCLIASILFIPKKLTQSYWRMFIPYLALVAVVETFSYLVGRVIDIDLNKHYIYNSFLLVWSLFHLWIFAKIIPLKNIKAVCITIGFAIVVCYIVEWAYFDFTFYLYRTDTFIGGIIVLLSVIYYISLFKQDEYHDILKDASFWFVTGCLIFYGTTTSINAFFEELVRIRIKGQVSLRYIIINIFNVIMYSCWIKSFLCLRNKKIYTQALS
ncbi:hypothetical protein ACQKCH_09300 [Nubsella zeaxanthinifaciens]|uniref:hypothetical protein n=1 Tax=Nubsella zeaxanthinifaciens TaxID=392412 RepID=UPI003CFEF731